MYERPARTMSRPCTTTAWLRYRPYMPSVLACVLVHAHDRALENNEAFQTTQRFTYPYETFSKKLLWHTVLISWHLKLNGEVVSGLPGHHSLENLVLSGLVVTKTKSLPVSATTFACTMHVYRDAQCMCTGMHISQGRLRRISDRYPSCSQRQNRCHSKREKTSTLSTRFLLEAGQRNAAG